MLLHSSIRQSNRLAGIGVESPASSQKSVMSRLIDSRSCVAEGLLFVSVLLSLAAKPLDAITESFNGIVMFVVSDWPEDAVTKHLGM